MILLDRDEVAKLHRKYTSGSHYPPYIYPSDVAKLKAQAKKILIKLQAIYNLPEIGMYDDKMKEFIKELEEEVK